MPTRSISQIALILALWTTAGPAAACAYNVRDVGFVDLGNKSYVLYVFFNADTEPGYVTALESAARDTFLESNVNAEFINLDETPDHELAEATAKLPKPAAILDSPDGRQRSTVLSGDSELIEETLSEIVSSPLRNEIIDELIKNYAMILVVEGPDGFDNEIAVEAAEGAKLHIESRMMMLPKAVDSPPVVRVVTQEDVTSDPVLFWSLGLHDTSETQVAVIYGRGRIMGAPLRGLDIEEETIELFLTIIGSDCECGLDRRWMEGQAFPAKWDLQQMTRVAAAVGFDPENPMVKMEISSALGKNAGANQSGSLDIEGVDEVLAGLTQGYREASVEFDNEPAKSPVESPATERAQPASAAADPAGMRVTSIAFGAVVLLGIMGGAVIWLRRGET